MDANIEIESDQEQEQETESSSGYQLVRDRAKRQLKPTQRYGFTAFTDMLAYAFVVAIAIKKEEPANYKEAIRVFNLKTG